MPRETLLQRLLPPVADNAHPGHRAALWLFATLVTMRAVMSLNSIFNGRFVAGRADGIALGTFTPAGADAVVAMFGAWGIAQLALCLIGLAILARYRALVPLMFSVLLLEQLSRRLMFQVLPIAKVGHSSGFAVNLVLIAVTIIGLALSLGRREEDLARSAGGG